MARDSENGPAGLLAFDETARAFRFAAAGLTVCWRARLEAGGREWRLEEAAVEVLDAAPLRLRAVFPDAGLAWTFTAEELPEDGTVLLHATLENRSARPVALGRVTPCLIDRLALPGEAVFLPAPPAQHDRIVYRLSDPEAPRWSKVKLQLYAPDGPVAVQIGFQTFLRANTEVHHRHDEGALCELTAWADFAGWELLPGDATPVETFVLAVGADPYRQLERWADRVAATGLPRQWPDAPVGWLGWTWVDAFNAENYQETMLRNCEAIARRLAGFGVGYVWLSIGNLPGGHPGAWTGWNDRSFPDGPEFLVRRLAALGITLGLWCGPFWVSSHLGELVAELGDALQRNPDGSLLVSRPRWDYGDCANLPAAERPALYALDPTHPKALALLQEAFAVNRARGVRYYMIDFLYAGAGNINAGAPLPGEAHAPYHDPRLVPGPESFRHALRVIRRAAGDETYLLASTGPTLHMTGIADAVRTGNDFGEGRAIAADSYFYPATYVINSAGFWTGCLPALRNQAAAWYTHRKLYLNDAGNVLAVDKPLPLSDARVHATIHALCGGPTMLGDDIDRIDDDRLALIKKTLPRPAAVAFPVDLFESPWPGHPKLFHRRVDAPWGRFDVLAVYNFSPDPLRLPVALERLGLDGAADYLVWDFWDERFVGRIAGTLAAEAAPGGVTVYRLLRDAGRPALLGTDMHLLMGEMEIPDCRWDAAARALAGRAVRPRGERGNLFLYVPPELRVAHPRGYWIAKDGRDGSLVVRVALDFVDGGAEWRVEFADR